MLSSRFQLFERQFCFLTQIIFLRIGLFIKVDTAPVESRSSDWPDFKRKIILRKAKIVYSGILNRNRTASNPQYACSVRLHA